MYFIAIKEFNAETGKWELDMVTCRDYAFEGVIYDLNHNPNIRVIKITHIG